MKSAVFIARMLAIVIAILGVVDPALEMRRSAKPFVSVVASGESSKALADRVASTLSSRFTPIRAPFAGSAVTVVVGDALPGIDVGAHEPVFAVESAADGPITITAVTAPPVAALDSRAKVDVSVRVPGSSSVDVALLANGVTVDRVADVKSTGGSVAVPLSYLPSSAGVARLTIVARRSGARDSTTADLAMRIDETRWSVLFFDRRPSWMSTFVRRAIEGDRRFATGSRIITSRGVSTDAGRAPSTLEDPSLLELYDAIVVGAPEALTDRDVDGLDRFLQRRGGGVVLLFDERPTGGAYDRLTHVARWSSSSLDTAARIAGAPSDTGALRSAELAWPTSLPATASVVGTDRNRHPIVWRAPSGAGRLLVSGALDAWKLRDPSTSAFETFWRRSVADAAAGAIPAVTIVPSATTIRPGESFDVTVVARDASLSTSNPTMSTVSASVIGDAGELPIRLWPTDQPGELRGRVGAPTAPGVYRIRATADGAEGDTPIIVVANAGHPTGDSRDAIRAMVTASGGGVFASDHLDVLRDAISARVPADVRLERRHPMHSAWWIVPFVALLGVEWWWRRRQGLV